MIRGIKEELESWTGSSSACSSPTFSHQNASPGLTNDSFSDEEKAAVADPYDFLRHVVVSKEEEKKDNRDTPSPGSTSSSSGFFSDVSCTTTTIQPIHIATPIIVQQPQISTNLTPIQFVQFPSIVPMHQPPATNSYPKPIVQIKPKPQVAIPTTNQQPKTIVLSPQDFSQLMKKMRVTRAAPRIQSQPLPAVKPQTVTTSPTTSITKGAQQQSSMFCLPHQVIDERTFKKQQRLIRNRESANLSRRKKKEFVDSLQETIQELGLEKEQLLSVRGEGIERNAEI